MKVISVSPDNTVGLSQATGFVMIMFKIIRKDIGFQHKVDSQVLSSIKSIWLRTIIYSVAWRLTCDPSPSCMRISTP